MPNEAFNWDNPMDDIESTTDGKCPKCDAENDEDEIKECLVPDSAVFSRSVRATETCKTQYFRTTIGTEVNIAVIRNKGKS